MKGKMRSLALVGALALVVVPASAMAGGEDTSIIADACAGCHGTDAASPGEMPGFANKTPEKIKEMLLEYKAGTKEATIMDRIVKAYTKEQLEAIANHYGAKN